MLQITVPARELWDEASERFIRLKETTLKLEHSLISISKWESKWCKPYFETEDKTDEEIRDYIKCMTLNTNVDDLVYQCLTYQNISDINNYVMAPMTASTVKTLDEAKAHNNEFITSELIYYWMIAYNIPVEFEKWHINRLIMLIRICSEKNKPPKKMTTREALQHQRALKAARRAKRRK